MEPPIPTEPAAPRTASRWLSRGIYAVLGTFVLLAGLYSVVIPPFETPDEIWHYAFVQHVATGQGLPVASPRSQALWRQQGVQAPAYYLAAAALTAWIDQRDFPAIYARANPHAAIGWPDAPDNRNFLIHHADEAWPWRGSILGLHIARFFSVALGAVALAATYGTLLLLLPQPAALAGTALVAFIPQFIFISASASNDNAVNALAALALWQMVALAVQPGAPPMRRWLLLGATLGLAVLAKLSALGLLALAGLVILWAARRERSWRILWSGSLGVATPVLLVGGWWYWRNWQLYGDPLAWNIWQANILLRVETAGWRTILGELGSVERSFWGLFGWLNVQYAPLLYSLLRAIELLIAFGLAVAAVRWLLFERTVDRRWAGGALLLAWLALLTVSWLRFMLIAPAAQGRYFFPALPALALLAAIGVRAWRIPTLDAVVVSCLLAISIATPFWVIAPAYQPPPAAEEGAAQTPIDALLGGEIRLLRVSASPAQLYPGDVAQVTAVWAAEAAPARDYSVFVHLVDDQGLIVGQRDTMPGGGLRPTSQWSAGEQYVEQYRVNIPATAYTPNRAHWRIGLYDHTTGQRLPVAPVDVATADGPVINPAANAVDFGNVAILAPPGDVPNPMDLPFADNVSLMGYTLDSRQLVPGESVEVVLYWQARGPIPVDYTSFVHLLDTDYRMFGGHDGKPAPPMAAWATGQIMADRHRFQVNEDALPGLYQLEIGLYNPQSHSRLTLLQADGAEGADRVLLGPLEVVSPAVQ